MHCAGRYLCVVMLSAGFIPAPAVAHDSPNDVIDALSHRIEDDGATAELLVSRAYEYRAYGDSKAAEADLSAALSLDPKHGPAYISLGQLYLADGNLGAAGLVIESGLAAVVASQNRAALLALSAEVHGTSGEWVSALDAIESALAVMPGDVDWILLKSRCLGALERHGARVDYLQEISKENSSIVLAIEGVNALRDAGRYAEGLRIVDGYIAERRWKSDWLLRRAEILRAMGDRDGARADGQQALDEIEVRLEENSGSFLRDEQVRARSFLESLAQSPNASTNSDDLVGTVSVTVLETGEVIVE